MFRYLHISLVGNKIKQFRLNVRTGRGEGKEHGHMGHFAGPKTRLRKKYVLKGFILRCRLYDLLLADFLVHVQNTQLHNFRYQSSRLKVYFCSTYVQFWELQSSQRSCGIVFFLRSDRNLCVSGLVSKRSVWDKKPFVLSRTGNSCLFYIVYSIIIIILLCMFMCLFVNMKVAENKMITISESYIFTVL